MTGFLKEGTRLGFEGGELSAPFTPFRPTLPFRPNSGNGPTSSWSPSGVSTPDISNGNGFDVSVAGADINTCPAGICDDVICDDVTCDVGVDALK